MKLPPASHTLHKAHEQCPRKAWHSYIARDIEREESEPMRWGIYAHKAIEAYLTDDTPLPPALQACAPLYGFKAQGYDTDVELKLGIRVNETPCGFFDEDVYARGVLDLVVTSKRAPDMALLIDHKTGKVREDPDELRFHAALLKVHKPQLRIIKGWYTWLSENRIGKLHDLSDTDTALDELLNTHERIERAWNLGANAFPPKQGPLCGWCPVKHCEYHP